MDNLLIKHRRFERSSIHFKRDEKFAFFEEKNIFRLGRYCVRFFVAPIIRYF